MYLFMYIYILIDVYIEQNTQTHGGREAEAEIDW